MSRNLTFFAIGFLILLVACEREARRFSEPSASSSPADTGSEMSPLHPGGGPPLKPGESQSEANNAQGPYENTAYNVAEGQKLYESFNCSGCHFHGGGGIGPPLMDANWIYGSQPQNIHDTILEGRPNGMPSFRGKIPEFQVWEIVAYVRSMSGQLRMDVAPGRSDHMSYKKPEQSGPKENPTQR